MKDFSDIANPNVRLKHKGYNTDVDKLEATEVVEVKTRISRIVPFIYASNPFLLDEICIKHRPKDYAKALKRINEIIDNQVN